MPRSFSQIYYHIFWTTKYRKPVISYSAENTIREIISKLAGELKGKLICLNSAWDHIHILVRLRPITSVASFMHLAKGRSARKLASAGHGINTMASRNYWQESYTVISVSPDQVGRVMQYIKIQKIHHRNWRGH